jgi:hypothetical protein
VSSSLELLESIIGEISPNSETQNSSDFGHFQSPEEEERGEKNEKKHQIHFYIWFSIGSQKYRMMIKEWYFIFG